MKKIFCLALLFLGIGLAAKAQSDTTLQQYTGKYKFAEGSIVLEAVVSLENGSLSVNTSAGSSPLEKQSDDVFVITAFQGTAVFKRNDAKKVIGVSINAMGYALEGTKEDIMMELFEKSGRKI
ncbi:MAG: hypothetical protein EAZ35_09420 [Sphingobacteriia bacterium]|nr:MAG: hypothetical protein EAZ35_09420 [Sphingobacteriia bacterium]